MAYNFFTPNLRKLLSAVFDTTSGHNHDGTNSKLVNAGQPAAGALSADTTGRAIIANNYFDATTIASKVADGAFTSTIADAKFADSVWKLDKLDAEAKTHILQIPVEDLGAGEDIAQRFVFEAPLGFDVTLVSANILSQGTATGIDSTNSCVVLLEDAASNEIAKSTYNDANPFPSVGNTGSLGTINPDHKTLSSGGKLFLSVTNGTAANPPRFVIQIVYTMAAAA